MVRTALSEVGQRVHTLVGSFAADDLRRPGPAQVLTETGKLLRAQPLTCARRAGRQRVACLTASYFTWFVPPDGWTFLGAERPADGGRVDLAWQSADGAVLFDEVTLGTHVDALLDSETSAQVERYLRAGAEEFGDRFTGVRLLGLASPRSSLHLVTLDEFEPLVDTPWWFHSEVLR